MWDEWWKKWLKCRKYVVCGGVSSLFVQASVFSMVVPIYDTSQKMVMFTFTAMTA